MPDKIKVDKEFLERMARHVSNLVRDYPLILNRLNDLEQLIKTNTKIAPITQPIKNLNEIIFQNEENINQIDWAKKQVGKDLILKIMKEYQIKSIHIDT